MKKLLKICIYFIIIAVSLVVILALVAKLAENKISDIALKKVSETIEAPVVIDNVSFTLLRKFPLATIELNDVLLSSAGITIDSANSSSKLDTIISISKIYISVKSKPLLDGSIEVMKIDVDGAKINYFVDSSGVSNVDFLMSSSDTIELDTLPSEPLNLTLSDLSLKNVVCNFIDSSLKMKAKASIPELNAVDVKIKGENITASVNGNVSLSDCNLEGSNLYRMINTDVDFDINYENDSISIKQLLINTDGAKLNLEGSVCIGEEIETDISLHATDLILNELVKYAPKEILNEYGLNKISGKLNADVKVKGLYSESEKPHLDINVDFQDGNVVTKDYPELKNLSFNGNITNGILRNNQSTQAKFDSFHFETEESKFDIEFSVLDIDNLKYDVNANVNINVEEFKDFIPDSLIESISGNIKAEVSTKGQLPDSIGDDFVDYVMANTQAKIKLSDFNVNMEPTISIENFATDFTYKPNNIKISNLSINIPTYGLGLKNTSLNTDFFGSINNTSELSLNVKSYHLETKGAEISGSVKVKNLDRPSYDMETKIAINLEETRSMLPDSLLSDLNGNLMVNIKSKATINLDSISDQAIDAAFNKSTVNVEMKNITAAMFDEPLYTIENLSGFIKMSPEKLQINKIGGVVGGIELRIDSTVVENIYNTIVKNQTEQLTVNTRLSLGDIDYAMFAPFMVTDSTMTDSASKVSEENEIVAINKESEDGPFNFSILIKGVAKVRSLTYGEVFVQEISSLFNIQDSVYIIDQFKFKAFEGHMNTSVKYVIKSENRSTIEMHNIIEDMNIKTLMKDFDDFRNFYEPSISHENLSGLFSTDLYTRINMIGDSLLMDDMRARGTFKLEDGGVYNFEPATNLSVVSNIHELDNIKFKTLDSKVFVSKNAIYLPETFISSETVNISAFGMQSFSDDFEYHLEVKLRDVLMGKSEKVKRKERKVSEESIEDDRNMRKLFYSQVNGKTDYGFSSKEQRSKMKSSVELKHKLLNLRFHPEMFNFETKVYSKENK